LDEVTEQPPAHVRDRRELERPLVGRPRDGGERARGRRVRDDGEVGKNLLHRGQLGDHVDAVVEDPLVVDDRQVPVELGQVVDPESDRRPAETLLLADSSIRPVQPVLDPEPVLVAREGAVGQLGEVGIRRHELPHGLGQVPYLPVHVEELAVE